MNEPEVKQNPYHPSGDEQPCKDESQPELDFLSGVKACDLSGEGTCDSCQ